jgi:hypothetical protein
MASGRALPTFREGSALKDGKRGAASEARLPSGEAREAPGNLAAGLQRAGCGVVNVIGKPVFVIRVGACRYEEACRPSLIAIAISREKRT